MIIRNQNKKAIINFNLISDLVISKDRKGDWDIIACYPYFAQSDCGLAVIGTYSTEEKAIKVLDMIQEAFYRQWDVENKFVDVTKNDTPIFQMPQDEEVEV